MFSAPLRQSLLQLSDEDRERTSESATNSSQLDNVDPSFAALRLTHPGLRFSQTFGELLLCQIRALSCGD